jgi:hypothetical protein
VGPFCADGGLASHVADLSGFLHTPRTGVKRVRKKSAERFWDVKEFVNADCGSLCQEDLLTLGQDPPQRSAHA